MKETEEIDKMLYLSTTDAFAILVRRFKALEELHALSDPTFEEDEIEHYDDIQTRIYHNQQGLRALLGMYLKSDTGDHKHHRVGRGVAMTDKEINDCIGPHHSFG